MWCQAAVLLQAFPVLIDGNVANVDAFRAIAATSFAICLDSQSPASHVETARGMLHGDGRNRWYDKSMQFIVYANGKAGMLGEVWTDPVNLFRSLLFTCCVSAHSIPSLTACQPQPSSTGC